MYGTRSGRRVFCCCASVTIQPSRVRPRTTSIVGIGVNRSERLEWASAANTAA